MIIVMIVDNFYPDFLQVVFSWASRQLLTSLGFHSVFSVHILSPLLLFSSSLLLLRSSVCSYACLSVCLFFCSFLFPLNCKEGVFKMTQYLWERANEKHPKAEWTRKNKKIVKHRRRRLKKKKKKGRKYWITLLKWRISSLNIFY